MADMRRFVRVDGGVLDDFFLGHDGGRCVGRPQPRGQGRRSIQKEVHVAVRRRFDPGYALNLAERCNDFLRDHAGRLAQAAGELERHRYREIAEGASWRYRDRDVGKSRVVRSDLIEPVDGIDEARSHALMDRKNHVLSGVRWQSEDGRVSASVIRFRVAASLSGMRSLTFLARS